MGGRGGKQLDVAHSVVLTVHNLGSCIFATITVQGSYRPAINVLHILLASVFVQPLIFGRSVKYLSLASFCICPSRHLYFSPLCSLFNG